MSLIEQEKFSTRKARQLDHLVYCNSDAKFKRAIDQVDGCTILAGDTETTGLFPERGAKLRLIQIATENVVSVFDTWNLSKKNINHLQDFIFNPKIKWIFHNAKFDVKFLKVWSNYRRFKNLYCTMIGSQLYYCNNLPKKAKVRHSLQACLKRELEIDIDKFYQNSNWSNPYLSYNQIKYASEDVCWLHELREKQIEKLRADGLLEVTAIEMQVIEPIAHMELSGFGINWQRWLQIARRQEIRAIRMREKISKMIGDAIYCQQSLFDEVPIISINSNKDLRKHLKVYGLQLPLKFDPKSGTEKETLEIDYLEKIKNVDTIVPLLIKHGQLKQKATAFGPKYEKYKNPLTHRLHSSINQVGAEMTGRFSDSNPNKQQIPSDSIYRRCFTARPGKKLIIADYSQMELRIVADLSNDKNMIKAFRENKDLHKFTASLVFKIHYDVVSKDGEERRRAKNLNFGVVYDIGVTRFADNAELEYDTAQQIMNDFYRVYYGLKRWKEITKAKTIEEKESRTFSGRRTKYYFKEDDMKEVSKVQRNGINMPVQGGNADITKIALRLNYDELHEKGYAPFCAEQVNTIHDEIIVECDEEIAEECEEILVRNMVYAGERYIKKVPVKVDSKISDCWLK